MTGYLSPEAYYCSGGAVQNLRGKSFAYSSKTIGADAITTTINQGITLNTNAMNLSKSDLSMTITVDGQAYTVNDYTITDPTINYRGGDNKITVAFGGVPVTVEVDMTGLAKKAWEEDNAGILNKGTVTKDDIDAINAAIASGKENPELTPQDLTDLYNKLAAAQWQADNEAVINITNPTINDYDNITAVKDAYDNLPPDVKQHIGATVTDAIADSTEKVEQIVDEGSNEFIGSYVSDEDNNVYTAPTSENIEQILSGQDDWNKLTTAEKNAVNEKLIAQGGKGYEGLVADAEKFIEDNKTSFIKDYVSDEDGDIYKKATSDNIDQILLGKDAWDQMSQLEKDAVNKVLTADDGKSYEDLIADANKVIAESKASFIKDYVSDEDGNIYKKPTSDNIDQILSGKDVWDQMSQAEKDAVNAALIADGGKSYEDMIADVANVIAETQSSFIKDYVSDEDGNTYKEATSENIDQILSGKDAWDKMSQAERVAVNAALVADGGKSYDDLIAEAEDLVEESQASFIKDYVSDKKGNMYKKPTSDNIDQILSGKDAWDQMSQAEKDAVNEALVANGGMPYEDLITEADKVIKENKASFIKDYVSDKKGNIYKEATSDNIDQILAGKDAWDKMSQAEKDAINAELIAKEGKSYEDLIAIAEKVVEESQASFIKDYVSDKKGNIYKKATSDNIDQILAGKDAWDKMSQAERDAVNAELIAKGGKSYDDLIATAEKMVKDNQTSFIKDYVSDKKGNVYKKVTSDNIDQILAGKDAWDKMSQAEKDAINAELIAKGGKAYEDLIAGAEKAVKGTTDSFR